MAVKTESIEVRTEGATDIVDITAQLREAIGRTGLRSGTATVFVPGSTASLSTIEFEPGAVKDFGILLERLAPRHGEYHHHATWGDDNGSSHARACLMGPSLVVPFCDGRPCLGTWQQVVLLDFDTRPRQRSLVVQVMGE
ncbi:MAG: secondary thiamine-phosphate synthase enzyme YjbQ [Myxococcales bacterium]|nr:secondary thiamine-phosphate synthase enzyme YjbQ [Myxococcales bacterium]